MTRETFLDQVKQHYSDEIQSTYAEFVATGANQMSMHRLTKRLKKLFASSKVEGLPVADFEELTTVMLPTEITKRLVFSKETLQAAA
jgi:hypothetical protein